MGNFGVFMSYCRFENTCCALEECIEDLQSIIEKGYNDLSDIEDEERKRLYELAKEVVSLMDANNFDNIPKESEY